MAKLRGDSDNESISSIISTYSCNTFREPVDGHGRQDKNKNKHKKAKRSHLTPEVVVEIEDRNGDLVPIRALLDTGTTATILLKKFVRKGRAKSYKGKTVSWNTMGGSFLTKQKCLVDFKFPEFSNSKTVTYVVHVDERTPRSTATYDMIIGMDLITDLGINIQTSQKSVEWEGITIPLKERHQLGDPHQLHAIYEEHSVPTAIKQAEHRQAKILDADYSAVDINEHVHSLRHLALSKQEKLAKMLHKHPQSFKGGLGTLNIRPVHLELRKDAKPYHARAFPVLKSLEATT